MTCIQSYLTFNGNCREAMTFYKDCFGGELTIQTVGDSPAGCQMLATMKDYVLHATLTNDTLVLMSSDMVPEEGLIRGNAISLSLNCSSLQEIERYYERLSSGGRATQPLQDTFWGAVFGTLTDRFGNHWLLNFDKEAAE